MRRPKVKVGCTREQVHVRFERASYTSKLFGGYKNLYVAGPWPFSTAHWIRGLSFCVLSIRVPNDHSKRVFLVLLAKRGARIDSRVTQTSLVQVPGYSKRIVMELMR